MDRYLARRTYLKAIAIFPKGDCWHGGGLWTGKNKYWLNDGHGHTPLRDSTAISRDTHFQPPSYYGGECPGVYYLRLVRDGWTLAETLRLGKWKDMIIFTKPIGKGWTLRKLAHAELDSPEGKGCYWDEHELLPPGARSTIACPSWEWADLDGTRLVWAAGGKLNCARVTNAGLAGESELFDFNEMTFEAIEAPY